MPFCISMKCQVSSSLLASGSQMLCPLSQNMQNELKHYLPTDTASAQRGMCWLQQLFACLLLSSSMAVFFLPLVWWTFQLGPDGVTQSSEKCADPRSTFPSLCPAVFSLFFFFSSPLHKGGAKGHIWLNLFTLEGFAISLQDRIIMNSSS